MEVPGLLTRIDKSYQQYRSYSSIIFGGTVLEFSNKMDLTSQIKILNNLKHCQAICLKIVD